MSKKCLNCEEILDIPPDIYVGEYLECQSCFVEWEVKSVNPLKLVIVDEDWEEEENDYQDEGDYYKYED